MVGPTASGKSGLAIRVVLWLRKQAKNPEQSEGLPTDGEIISADSRQVYRGMDIGTGKVTKREQKLVRHHLLDVVSPKNPPAGGFSVAHYKKLAQKSLRNIQTRGKLPIVVGGTGHYIDALLRRVSIPEVPPNKKLRAKLEKQSVEQLFKRLHTLDPRRAITIDRHNKRRLIRALEIISATGKPVPLLVSQQKTDALWIGINPDRETLADNIKRRLNARLRQGMIKEVQKLRQQGVSWKRLDNFGLEYRWIARYLQKNISKDEMQSSLLRDIIRYSKRQMTWFKRNKDIQWTTTPEQAFSLVPERLPLP